MTEAFYIAKRQEYMGSGADKDVKKAAIERLDEQYRLSQASSIANQQHLDSEADYSDIGD